MELFAPGVRSSCVKKKSRSVIMRVAAVHARVRAMRSALGMLKRRRLRIFCG